jgi:hypothetical protein
MWSSSDTLIFDRLQQLRDDDDGGDDASADGERRRFASASSSSYEAADSTGRVATASVRSGDDTTSRSTEAGSVRGRHALNLSADSLLAGGDGDDGLNRSAHETTAETTLVAELRERLRVCVALCP